MTATLSESHDAPDGLPGRLDHFIAGVWSPSADGATFAVAGPVSNQGSQPATEQHQILESAVGADGFVSASQVPPP